MDVMMGKKSVYIVVGFTVQYVFRQVKKKSTKKNHSESWSLFLHFLNSELDSYICYLYPSWQSAPYSHLLLVHHGFYKTSLLLLYFLSPW